MCRERGLLELLVKFEFSLTGGDLVITRSLKLFNMCFKFAQLEI